METECAVQRGYFSKSFDKILLLSSFNAARRAGSQSVANSPSAGLIRNPRRKGAEGGRKAAIQPMEVIYVPHRGPQGQEQITDIVCTWLQKILPKKCEVVNG